MPRHKDARLVALGQQIRKVRKAKGFAQEAFAAAADIDRSYYGGVERGEKNLSALNLIKIALALEVEVGDLFPQRAQLTALVAGETLGEQT
jgi:transcriptional regulator with XRE-family HTH domain